MANFAHFGNLLVRAEVASNDEIGALARNFNTMTETLLESQQLPTTIIQTIPGALFLTDEQGRIQQINAPVTKIFGYEEKDLIGQSVTALFPTTTTLHLIGLDELARGGSISDKFMTMRAKDGTEIPVILHGRVIKGTKGAGLKLLLVADDRRATQQYVTQRLSEITPILQKASTGDFSKNVEIPAKKDEFTEHLVALNLMIDDLKDTVGKNVELVKELEKEKASLEQKVTERTHDIDASNQQLKAANQQLNAANQQLSAAQKNLQDKLLELERFNKMAVGRELKMVELKEEIAGLKKKLEGR